MFEKLIFAREAAEAQSVIQRARMLRVNFLKQFELSSDNIVRSSDSPIGGTGNCSAWTSNTGGGSPDYGTTVYLPSAWSTGADIGIWEVSNATCDSWRRVWCVED